MTYIFESASIYLYSLDDIIKFYQSVSEMSKEGYIKLSLFPCNINEIDIDCRDFKGLLRTYGSHYLFSIEGYATDEDMLIYKEICNQFQMKDFSSEIVEQSKDEKKEDNECT